MSDLYYVCRTDCPAIGESRFRYLSRGHGWCNRFKDALPFTSAADARLLLSFGADRVVVDFGEVTVTELAEHFRSARRVA